MTALPIQLCIPGIVPSDADTTTAERDHRRDHLCTPPLVLDRVHRLDAIGLDPCAARGSHVGAFLEWYGPPHPCEDGLARSWAGYGLVYCFPPPRHAAEWAAKIAAESQRDPTLDIVALLPADTSAKWLHSYVYATASAICYLRGDLRCIGEPRRPVPPRLVAYWGARVDQFRVSFAPLGAVTPGHAPHRPTSWTLRLPYPFAVGTWIQQQGRNSRAVTEYTANLAADITRAAADVGCPPATSPLHAIVTRYSRRHTMSGSLALGVEHVVEVLLAQELLCPRSGYSIEPRQQLDPRPPSTQIVLRPSV